MAAGHFSGRFGTLCGGCPSVPGSLDRLTTGVTRGPAYNVRLKGSICGVHVSVASGKGNGDTNTQVVCFGLFTRISSSGEIIFVDVCSGDSVRSVDGTRVSRTLRCVS